MPKKNTATTQPHEHTHHDGHDHDHDHSHEPDQSVIAPNTTISITLPWAEIKPAYNAALKRLAKQVRSSGFRPGKVPPAIAADMIGQEKIKEEALRGLLTPAYQKALEASGKKPLTQPEFSAEKVDLGADWVITAAIAEKPEVTIKNYQKIAKKAKTDAEKEIAETEKNQKDPQAKSTEKETAEEKTTRLEKEAKDREDHVLQHILKALITELKPAIPELLIKTETRAELEQLVRSLEQFGLKFDDYLARRQITFEQLTNELASQALGRLQVEFILEAITAEQKLTVEDSDFDQYLNRITDEKARAQQKADPQYMAYLTGLVLRQKATRHLLSL